MAFGGRRIHFYEVRLAADGLKTISTSCTNLPQAKPEAMQLQPRRTALALNNITLYFGASYAKTRLLPRLPDETAHKEKWQGRLEFSLSRN